MTVSWNSLRIGGLIALFLEPLLFSCLFSGTADARPQNNTDQLNLILSRPFIQTHVIFESERPSITTVYGLQAICSGLFLPGCFPQQVSWLPRKTDCRPRRLFDDKLSFLVLDDEQEPTGERIDGYCLAVIPGRPSDAQVKFTANPEYGAFLQSNCGPACQAVFSSRHNSLEVQLSHPLAVNIRYLDDNGQTFRRSFSGIKGFRVLGTEKVSYVTLLTKAMEVRGISEIDAKFGLPSSRAAAPEVFTWNGEQLKVPPEKLTAASRVAAPEVFTWNGEQLKVPPEKLTAIFLRQSSISPMSLRVQGTTKGAALAVRSYGIGQIFANGNHLLRTTLTYEKKSLGPYRFSQQDLRNRKKDISVKLKQSGSYIGAIDLIGIHVLSDDPDISIGFVETSIYQPVQDFFSENYAFFEALEKKYKRNKQATPSFSKWPVKDKTREMICKTLLAYLRNENKIDEETSKRFSTLSDSLLFSKSRGDDAAIFIERLQDVTPKDFLYYLENQSTHTKASASADQLGQLADEGTRRFTEWLRTRLDRGVEDLRLDTLDAHEDLAFKGKLYSSRTVEVGRHTLGIILRGVNVEEVRVPIAIDVYDKYALLKSAFEHLASFLAGLLSGLLSDKIKERLKKILNKISKTLKRA